MFCIASSTRSRPGTKPFLLRDHAMHKLSIAASELRLIHLLFILHFDFTYLSNVSNFQAAARQNNDIFAYRDRKL